MRYVDSAPLALSNSTEFLYNKNVLILMYLIYSLFYNRNKKDNMRDIVKINILIV